MPKLLTAFLLLFCLALPACTSPSAPPAGPDAPPAAEFPVIEIRTETVRYRNEQINVDLAYPVLGGLADPDRAATINHFIAAAALAFKDNLEQEAQAWADRAATDGFGFLPYSAAVTYDVPYNRDDLLSIRINYESYTGGAHGATTRKTLNLDTVTGAELHLGDFFHPESDYLTHIREEIINRINAAPDDYFPDAAAGLTVPADQFYLTDGAVVVYFAEYAIAPYAAGMPEFSIPAERRLQK